MTLVGRAKVYLPKALDTFHVPNTVHELRAMAFRCIDPGKASMPDPPLQGLGLCPHSFCSLITA